MADVFFTQSLATTTLVAGKTSAMRLFLASSAQALTADRVELVLLRPDGSRVSASTAGDLRLISIPTSVHDFVGPSVVALIPGQLLPDVGTYYVRAQVLAGASVLAEHHIDHVRLLPTKDLRMIVARVWSGTATKPGELQAARRAMQRLAAIYPIRDGISSLNGDRNAGLRYNLDNDPSGTPKQDANLGPLYAKWRNRPPDEDSIDSAVAYRFPNAGEGWGGSAGHMYAGLDTSLLVWGASTMANVFSQETSHCFGLEPKEDPHLDPGHQRAHSNDVLIDPLDAGLGFECAEAKERPDPTYDVMYWELMAPDDVGIALNAWDWEYLRDRLAKLKSTGPSGPFIFWTDLAGRLLSACPAVATERRGNLLVLALGKDRQLHCRRQLPDATWAEWTSLGGHDLREPVVLAANADGNLQAFALGGNQKVYYRTESGPGGPWEDWKTLGGTKISDFAVGRNADGRLEVSAVWGDGTLHTVDQNMPNGDWGAWSGGVGAHLRGPVALASNADGRVEAFAVGGDAVVYHRWQVTVNAQGGWSDWDLCAPVTADQPKAVLPKVSHLAVRAGADGRLWLFLLRQDNRITWQVQDTPNATAQSWNWPVDLGAPQAGWTQKDSRPTVRWPFSVTRNADGRLEVLATGQDGHLYNTWQVDTNRWWLWSDWVNLGGRQLNAGLASIVTTTPGWTYLSAFAVGGDGHLYGGGRGST